MNSVISLWLAINAIIGLPVLGIAIYCKVKELRSKRSGLARVSDRVTDSATNAALELNQAA